MPYFLNQNSSLRKGYIDFVSITSEQPSYKLKFMIYNNENYAFKHVSLKFKCFEF